MIYTFQLKKHSHHTVPISVHMLGINHRQEPVHRQKGLDVFQWFYCSRGKGELIIDQNKVCITPGEGALIYPKVPHSYHALTDNWLVHFVGFSGPFCVDLLQTLRMHESNVYHFANKDIFPEHIQKLALLRERKIKNKTAELSKECYSFLLDLSLNIKRVIPASPVADNQFCRELIDYLEDNYSRDISLDELAEQTRLSKGYLCALFKKYTGQSIMHYLLTIRISHAKIFLIQYSDKKVYEIARLCGFDSPSYFTKIFKRVTGITPEDYRAGKY